MRQVRSPSIVCESLRHGTAVLLSVFLLANAGECLGIDAEVFFETKVRPILHERCIKCHGPEKQKAGLRLDSLGTALAGGDSGAALVPGDAEGSRLVQAIGYQDSDLEMPPKKKLIDAEIAVLTQWVASGAIWPGSSAEAPVVAKLKDPTRKIWQAAGSHWSFQAIQSYPAAENESSWGHNGIDGFVLEKLEQHGLSPSGQADRRSLIRRAYLDMLGLPPSAEEIVAFVADRSPAAWNTVIDRLLESPHYGERWARHWMDVARYADNKGAIFAEAREYPYAYTYRDYLIRAFNDDKPFDQFVTEQIAADLLPSLDDPRDLSALAFLTLNRRIDGKKANQEQVNDRIDVVTRGFLGLTVSCARCHDHKYDPVPTADYYSLYGVFESCEEPAELPIVFQPDENDPLAASYRESVDKEQRQLDEFIETEHAKALKKFRDSIGDYLSFSWQGRELKEDVFRVRAAKLKLAPEIALRWRAHLKGAAEDSIFHPWSQFADETAAEKFAARFLAFDERLRKQHGDIRLDRKTPAELKLNADESALYAVLYGPDAPGILPAGDFKKLDRSAYLSLKKKKSELALRSSLFAGAPQRAMVLHDKSEAVEPVVFLRGDAEKPGEKVPRQFLAILSGEERAPFAKAGSGRLELARAITDPENPLTARVIVNRVWMHHFGRPLVATPSDFGLRCETPDHLKLLDHLASGLIEQAWSLKWLHREILQSATWKQQSHGDLERDKIDPDNRWWWHYPRRRLDFESLRDSMLAASGQLDRTLGGPSVIILSSQAEGQGALGDGLWAMAPERRSLYGLIDRVKLPSVMRTFDFANPDESSAQRPETTVPLQALYLMNNDFVADTVSEVLSRPEIDSAPDDEKRVRRLYLRILGRYPLDSELKLALRYLDEENDRDKVTQVRDSQQSPWRYGYAPRDAKTSEVDFSKFTPFPHREGSSWQGAKEFPDKGNLGWLRLSPVGGHAGHSRFAVIRRWVSPIDGLIDISAKLEHTSDQGDGVRGRIIHNGETTLGTWKAFQSTAPTDLSKVMVASGDTIDHVVDQIESGNYDSFNWSPEIRWVNAGDDPNPGTMISWNAKRDFYEVAGSESATGDDDDSTASTRPALERLTQVLLMSNEFAYFP